MACADSGDRVVYASLLGTAYISTLAAVAVMLQAVVVANGQQTRCQIEPFLVVGALKFTHLSSSCSVLQSSLPT